MLAKVKKSFELKTEEKGIKLKLKLDDEIPDFVKGDQVRLNQVLTNLLGNSVKFTEKGSITIETTFVENRDGYVRIHFSVNDTGIGIEEDNIQLIFERFSQENTSMTRRYGGSGLGLAITKRLLELQGSEINVKSKKGEGSQFYFELLFKESAKSRQNSTLGNAVTLNNQDAFGR